MINELKQIEEMKKFVSALKITGWLTDEQFILLRRALSCYEQELLGQDDYK